MDGTKKDTLKSGLKEDHKRPILVHLRSEVSAVFSEWHNSVSSRSDPFIPVVSFVVSLHLKE